MAAFGGLALRVVHERQRCSRAYISIPTRSGTAWKIVAVADINGDARADLIWQHDQGWLAVWYMNGSTMDRQSSI